MIVEIDEGGEGKRRGHDGMCGNVRATGGRADGWTVRRSDGQTYWSVDAGKGQGVR
jgi:hypothetical protein